MPGDFIINLFTIEGFLQLVKWLIMLVEGAYFLFAIILIREVSLMNRSFKTEAAILFKFLAFAHLGATAVAILISLSLI